MNNIRSWKSHYCEEVTCGFLVSDGVIYSWTFDPHFDEPFVASFALVGD